MGRFGREARMMITFVGIDFKVQLSAEAMLMGRLDQ